MASCSLCGSEPVGFRPGDKLSVCGGGPGGPTLARELSGKV